MIKLTDICTPKQWKTLSSSDLLKSGYPVYGANGIIGYWNVYNHKDPTVLITCRGATCGSVNLSKPFSYINGNAMCLDNVSDNYDVKFLFHYLSWYDFSNIITGSAQPQITRQSLSKVYIPLIDKKKQQDIVHDLTVIERALINRQQALSILNHLVKSRFIEMFGDPVLNPMGWEIKPLLEMGDCKNGMNFHKGESGIELNCLGVGDFQNLSVIADTSELPTVSLNAMPSKEYLLENEDIVFVRSNGNKNLVGRCVAVYPNDTPTVFSGFCIRFRLADRERLTIGYLLQVLKHESMRMKMTGRGANIQNLNQQILSTLEIPLPPIDIQNQFANFVALADKSKSAVQQSIDTLQTLNDKLMQDYFG